MEQSLILSLSVNVKKQCMLFKNNRHEEPEGRNNRLIF